MLRPTASMLAFVCLAALAIAKTDLPTISIGITRNMLPGEEQQKFDVIASNYKTVLTEQGQLNAEVKIVPTADELHKNLVNGKIQLGGFQGFEYAWLKQQHPDLEQVLIAGPAPDVLFEVFVVAKDSPAKTFADCRGMKLAIAKDAREDTRHFLARRCQQNSTSVKDMFGELLERDSAETALDSVIDGTVQAAVADRGAWKMMERRKPARAAKLRIVDTSEPFLPSVVACIRGKLDPEIVKKYRDTMIACHTTPKGGHLVSQIKIVKFDPIPADFDKRLAESLKAYPPPTSAPVSGAPGSR